MTALRFAFENVRMHENNTPKRRALVLCGTITDVTSEQEMTSELLYRTQKLSLESRLA